MHAFQGAPSCWFSEAALREGSVAEAGEHSSSEHAPLSTLLALERTIAQRRAEMEADAGTPQSLASNHGAVSHRAARLRALRC